MESVNKQHNDIATVEYTPTPTRVGTRWNREECQAMQHIWSKHLHIHEAANYSDMPWCKHQDLIARELYARVNFVERSGNAIGVHVRGRKCKHGCKDLEGPQTTKAFSGSTSPALSDISPFEVENRPIFTTGWLEDEEIDASSCKIVDIHLTLPEILFQPTTVRSGHPLVSDEESLWPSAPPELFTSIDLDIPADL